MSQTLETAELLAGFSTGLYIGAAVTLAIAITLFFVFKIPSVIGDLTGATAKRSIEKMRSGNGKATAVASTGKKSKKDTVTLNKQDTDAIGGNTTQRVATTAAGTGVETTDLLYTSGMGAAPAAAYGGEETTPLQTAAYGTEETTPLQSYGTEETTPLQTYAAPQATAPRYPAYGTEETTPLQGYGTEETTPLQTYAAPRAAAPQYPVYSGEETTPLQSYGTEETTALNSPAPETPLSRAGWVCTERVVLIHTAEVIC